MTTWEWIGVTLIAIGVSILSRFGHTKRISTLESAMTTLQTNYRDDVRTETDRAISSARASFKAEVEAAMRPLSSSIDEQGKDIGQLKTMVGKLVNEQH